MKKINRLFVFTGFLIGIIFFGCDNSFTNKTNEIEYGQVTISVSEKDNMQRTIFPQKINLSATSGLIFKLTGTLISTGTPYTKTWEDITTGVTTIYAYTSMVTTEDILLQTGTWSFNLTVSRTNDSNTDEFIFTSSITQEIKGGSNTLNFTLSEATSDYGEVANGNISIKITFPNTASVSSVTGTLTNMVGDSNSVTDSTEITPTGSSTDISLTTDNTNSSVSYSKNVEPGNYLLVFSFYQNKDNDNKIIKTWTSIVKVAPGATSSYEITIDNFNTIYTLTLDYGYAKDETDKTNTTQNVSFNSLTTITLPTPARDGYTFDGWYTKDNNENGDLVYGENAGKSFVGGDYNADTKLYAKWTQRTAYVSTWEELVNYVDTTEVDTIVITAALTATNTATIQRDLTIKNNGGYTISKDTSTDTTGAVFKIETTKDDNGDTITPIVQIGTADAEVFSIMGTDTSGTTTEALIVNDGDTTITNVSIIQGNSSSDGGGIYNRGTLTLNNCSISSCTSTASGGGIYNADNATLTMVNGSVISNTATSGLGSNVYVAAQSTFKVSGSPFIDEVYLAYTTGPSSDNTYYAVITQIGDFETETSITIEPAFYTTEWQVVKASEGFTLDTTYFQLQNTAYKIDEKGYIAENNVNCTISISVTAPTYTATLDGFSLTTDDANPTTVTATIPDGAEISGWYVNGTKGDTTSKSYTLTETNAGVYTVMVVIKYDDNYYSGSVEIKISETKTIES